MPRKLVTILSLDAVGYSALVAADEALTLKRLRRDREAMIDPLIASHGGRVFKWLGDGCLAEFPSAVEALHCAVAIAAETRRINLDPPPLTYRFGLHVGDVVDEGGDLMGDGVNVAARLQAAAKPGEILLSDEIRRQVEKLAKVPLEPAGDLILKNLPGRYSAFRVSVSAPARPAPVPGDPRLSIAVLPFQNMSRDPEQEDFCDGVVEEIISRLSRLKWLLVIARNSTFVYKGRNVDIQQVARELNVRYVLEGSVRKAAQKVRITAQLIDAATGAHVWAERFDGDVSDIFKLQDDVTLAVVGAIEPALIKSEAARARGAPTDNIDAWTATMKAMGMFFRPQRPDEHAEAQSLLRRAIELAPQYALPKALLSWSLLWDTSRGWLEVSAVTAAEARRLADEAVTCDDDEAWTHIAVGLCCFRAGEYESALAAHNEALVRNPSSAYARGVLGTVCVISGRLEEGERHMLEALRLSPNDPLVPLRYSSLAATRILVSDFQGAVEWAQKSLRLNANYPQALRNLVVAYGAMGDIERARSTLAKLRSLDPSLTVAKYRRSHPMLGRLGELHAHWLRVAGLPEE
jgi:TolB-like protein